uniref:Uncharacterized protein n=1 Tax=Arundo donax TaxID=35708 RepID=A0A0A8ZTW1_ARUDO
MKTTVCTTHVGRANSEMQNLGERLAAHPSVGSQRSGGEGALRLLLFALCEGESVWEREQSTGSWGLWSAALDGKETAVSARATG